MYSEDLVMMDGGSDGNTFNMFSPSAQLDGGSNITSPGGSNQNMEKRHAEVWGRLGNHQQTGGETFGAALHLSVLYYDLGKLLSMLRSMPWDMTKIMQLTCVHDARGDFGKDYQEASLEENPLAGILRRSTEFVELLRTYQRSKASLANATTGLAIDPRPGVSDLLGTLSCHMLILSTYDCIFHHFIAQYQQNPGPFEAIMQSTPQFLLGGIAIPPQPNMLGHLLFTLTESRLRPIELLLGLPDEFCVTRRRSHVDEDADDGLFSGQSYQSLFVALMQIEAERDTGDVSGIGVIKSLREKMRHAQALK